MRWKRLIAITLCIASLCVATGCGNNSVNDNKTIIRVDNFTGGIGVQWLKDAAARFEIANAETEFEAGKKGVTVDISTISPEPSTISTSGYHIFFDERFSNIFELSLTGKLVPLDDVIQSEDKNGKTLESKIYSNVLDGLKGNDGKYYALPHYEWFPGVTYDRETFDFYDWYFAKDAENGKPYNSKYGSALFIKNADSEKSCGLDGVYGTEDDGLPTSLTELIVLCSKISERTRPFMLTGMYPYYANYLVQGLWASLAGKEEMRALYDMTGKVEVVTGYSNEPLLSGINYVKKPITEIVEINKDNAHLAFNSAARYYACAFIKILTEEGWFSNEATQGNMSHVETEKVFIFGGINSQTERRAFLIEGSYWYNESVASNNFAEYFQIAKGKTTRDVRFMPLPSSLDKTVEEGKARDDGKVSLIDNGIAYAYINARYQDDENIIKACKEFLKFVYSDEELRAFTASTGITRPINYELSESEFNGLSDYQKSVYKLARNSNILYFSSANDAFKRNQGSLKVQPGSAFLKPVLDGKLYQSYYPAFREGKYSVEKVFTPAFTSEVWSGMING